MKITQKLQNEDESILILALYIQESLFYGLRVSTSTSASTATAPTVTPTAIFKICSRKGSDGQSLLSQLLCHSIYLINGGLLECRNESEKHQQQQPVYFFNSSYGSIHHVYSMRSSQGQGGGHNDARSTSMRNRNNIKSIQLPSSLSVYLEQIIKDTHSSPWFKFKECELVKRVEVRDDDDSFSFGRVKTARPRVLLKIQNEATSFSSLKNKWTSRHCSINSITLNHTIHLHSSPSIASTHLPTLESLDTLHSLESVHFTLEPTDQTYSCSQYHHDQEEQDCSVFSSRARARSSSSSCLLPTSTQQSQDSKQKLDQSIRVDVDATAWVSQFLILAHESSSLPDVDVEGGVAGREYMQTIMTDRAKSLLLDLFLGLLGDVSHFFHLDSVDSDDGFEGLYVVDVDV